MGPIPCVAVLWALFLVIEVSDLFDGLAARRNGTVSDFGKLFDPYADLITATDSRWEITVFYLREPISQG